MTNEDVAANAFRSQILAEPRKESCRLAVFDEETRVAAMHALELARLSLSKRADCSKTCNAVEDSSKQSRRSRRCSSRLLPTAESLRQEAAEPDQRKAFREARKQTSEAVIDASNQQARRGREHIVSLGAIRICSARKIEKGARSSKRSRAVSWCQRRAGGACG